MCPKGNSMINISREELNSLEIKGKGNFGTIYRRNNQALKVFNEDVKTNGYGYEENPLLKHRTATINKCRTLIRRNKRIQNTDLIEDLLYIDGVFYGTVMPFYDGQLMLECRTLPIEKIIEYARSLVINGRELTDHLIYPTDYKLNNIFVVNDKVKLIDLDDVYTKVWPVKPPLLQEESISILDKTIKSLLSRYHYYGMDVKQRLSRDKKTNKTYQEIEEYLDRESKKIRLLFVDDTFNLIDDRLLDNSRVVVISDSEDDDYLLSIIDRLNSMGIAVYDIIKNNELEDYIYNRCYSECLYSQKNKVLKLK